LVELSNGSVVRETRMVADGRGRPVSQDGCAGTESMRWSARGSRLYLSTQMTCGEQISRNTTGVFALLSPSEWVSIQAIAVDAEAATRIVRYQLVESPTNVPEAIVSALRQNRLARETARMIGSAKLELTDVSEAAKNVHGRAVEALLFERKQGFDLNGKKLVALADAGVPDYLIDAVVAVSHPQRFAVRDARPTELEQVPGNRRGSNLDRYCDEFWYDRLCSSSRYGFGNYGYSPFGYSPYGYDRYGFGSPPVVVIIQPDSDEPQWRHGSVSRRGYSSGSSSSSSGSGRSVSSSGSSSTSSTASGSSSSSGSGSSSSSSSRGQAKPRGGN
jgi:hypothetical protein